MSVMFDDGMLSAHMLFSFESLSFVEYHQSDSFGKIGRWWRTMHVISAQAGSGTPTQKVALETSTNNACFFNLSSSFFFLLSTSAFICRSLSFTTLWKCNPPSYPRNLLRLLP